MEALTIQQAISQISVLLEKAFSGEEILIKKNDNQIIKITAISNPQKHPTLFGMDKDKIHIAEDFDEPLEEFAEYR
jgi:antitoxin (DNA-binding transcriptional repressor) of toxin-antitoxin stability system